MRRLTRNEQLFIKKVKEHCKEYGIKVELRDVMYLQLDKNSRCTGYFDEENMKLVCAMKRPDSFSILVHEYAHFTQWIEQCKPWVNLGNSLSHLMDWLDGKNVRSIAKHIAACRNMELDNEKRSAKLIKEYDLNIDLDFYIKRANAYVMFYNYLLISRRWSKPNNAAYRNKAIVAQMSSKFNMNYKKPPKKLMALYESEGI